MSIIKQKLLNAITAYPKLVTLGIGLALTLGVIGTTITGILDHSHSAFARALNGGPGGISQGGNSGNTATNNPPNTQSIKVDQEINQ
jgi:hypothetical protein